VAKKQWISADAWRDTETGVIYVKSITYSKGTDRAGETVKFPGEVRLGAKPPTLPPLEVVAARLAEDGYKLEAQRDRLQNGVALSFVCVEAESGLAAWAADWAAQNTPVEATEGPETGDTADSEAEPQKPTEARDPRGVLRSFNNSIRF